MMRASRFALAALCASLMAATAAPSARAVSLGVQAAPGRVLLDVAGGRASIAAVAPLPDGGALLAGTVARSGDVYVVRVSPSGLPDQSFGSGGIADVHAGLAFEQMLVQEDGRILLVGRRSPQGYRGPLPWQQEHLPLAVVRLLPDGSLDTSFGTGGTAPAGIEGGCHCADVAVLGHGDALTLTGQRAERKPRERRPTYQWALARLTSSGAPDATFGVAGVATVPGKDGTGLSLESVPGSEELAAQGMQTLEEKDPNGGIAIGPANVIAKITSSGALDSGFGGGRPVKLPVYALSDSSDPPEPLDVVTEPDGRIVSETIVPTNPGHPKKGIGIGLVGFDAQGAFDPSFGFGGTLDLEEKAEPVGSQLIAEPDGSILAVHPRGSTRPTDNPPVIVPGLIEFERLTATGRFDPSFAAPPGKTTRVPFGGGNGEALPALDYSYSEPTFALAQNSFLDNESLPSAYLLADGRVLLAGDVSLTARQPGRRPERGTNRIALVLLDPSFELDPSAGAPGVAPVVSLSAPPQSARRDLARRTLRVRLETSAPGLAAIDVRVGGRGLAHRVVALLDTGASLVNVPLSRRARRFLAAHRHARLQVTADLHDLLAADASARGTLTLH